MFANELPDGSWGGGGRIARLADIAGLVVGEPEKGREYTDKRLSARQPVSV